MNDLAAIEAQLVDMRNVGTHKSLKLTLHVPEEHALKAIAAFGWPTGASPVPVALARMDETKTKQAPSLQPAAPKSRQKFDQMELPKQASLLCKEPVFQAFLREARNYHACRDADAAADIVREICGVQSRSEIRPGTDSADIFVGLRDRYITWKLVSA